MAVQGHRYDNISLNGYSQTHFGDVINYHPIPPPEDPDEYDKVLKRLQKSLAYERMDARLRNIAAAASDTCKWVRETQEFKQWTDKTYATPHDGVLWIKGKPGSGKSTIMRELVRWAQEEWKDQLVISYFFNARAVGDLEKTTIGLYRSLTHQFVSSFEAMRPVFYRFFAQKVNEGHVDHWTETELQNFLEYSIQYIDCAFNIFIDALDEGEDNGVRAMVQCLEQIATQSLARGVNIRICLASRHYPQITVSNAIYLVLDQQQAHLKDIIRYINMKLNKSILDDLGMTLQQRSGGVFLWVVLVVRLLNRASDQGMETTALRTKLDSIPDDLRELFRSILLRSTEDIDQCVTLLQWMLYARTTLHPTEMYDLILHKHVKSSMYLTKYTDRDSVWRAEKARISAFILNCSRGLVEITLTEPIQLQFIHETVRESLSTINLHLSQHMIGHGLYSGFKFDAKICHEIMTADCLKYLISTGKSECVRGYKDFQIGEYASHNWFMHFQQLELCSDSVLTLAAEFLISHPNDPSMRGPIWNHDFSAWQEVPKSPVYYSALIGSPVLVKRLIELGQEVNPSDADKFDPLETAARLGHTETVKVLLQSGADLTRQNGSYGSAIWSAASQGHREIVKLLGDAGADLLGSLEDYYGGPLQAACYNGHIDTAKFIIAELDIRDIPKSSVRERLIAASITAQEHDQDDSRIQHCVELMFGQPRIITICLQGEISWWEGGDRALRTEKSTRHSTSISDLASGWDLLRYIRSATWDEVVTSSISHALYTVHNNCETLIKLDRSLRSQGVETSSCVVFKCYPMISPARQSRKP